MSYYGSFVLQCYVLRMCVMTSTVGKNLTNRPPALRHIHVNISIFWSYSELLIQSFCHLIFLNEVTVMCSCSTLLLLGTFTKLQKVAISLVVTVHPSVCLCGTTWLPLDGFLWNLIFENFFKPVEKIQVWLKSDLNKVYFALRPMYIYDNILLNSS